MEEQVGIFSQPCKPTEAGNPEVAADDFFFSHFPN